MKIMGNIGSVYQTYKIDKKDKIEQKGLSEFEKVKSENSGENYVGF